MSNYKPKIYKRRLIDIVQDDCCSRFQFEETKDDGLQYIEVNESVDKINERIQDVIKNEKDTVYLSFGTRKINLEKISINKWQLFDKYDIYEFEIQ